MNERVAEETEDRFTAQFVKIGGKIYEGEDFVRFEDRGNCPLLSIRYTLHKGPLPKDAKVIDIEKKCERYDDEGLDAI